MAAQLVVVNDRPVLQVGGNDATNMVITAYGHPGTTYTLEWTTNLGPSAVWRQVLAVPLSGSLQLLSPPSSLDTNAANFFRLRAP